MRQVLGWEQRLNVGGSFPAPSEAARIRAETEAWIDLLNEPVCYVDEKPFRRARPLSEEDSAGGAVCARSGFWYPAHRLVMDGGVLVGDDQVRRLPDDG